MTAPVKDDDEHRQAGEAALVEQSADPTPNRFMPEVGSMAAPDDAGTIVALIQRAAIDPSFDVEKLNSLLEVKERWEKEEARKAFVAALAEFKQNPPHLVKDRQVDFTTNKGHTSYKYPSLGEVSARITVGLAEQGFSHSWAIAQEEGAVTVTCKLTHRLGHSESVEVTGPRDNSGNKNSIQQIGSSISYLERYSLMAITGLAAHDEDGDDDGRATSPQTGSVPERDQQAQHPSEEQAQAPKQDSGGGRKLDPPGTPVPFNRTEVLKATVVELLGDDIDERVANMDQTLMVNLLTANRFMPEEAAEGLGVSPGLNVTKEGDDRYKLDAKTRAIVFNWMNEDRDRKPLDAAKAIVTYWATKTGLMPEVAAEGSQEEPDEAEVEVIQPTEEEKAAAIDPAAVDMAAVQEAEAQGFEERKKDD